MRCLRMASVAVAACAAAFLASGACAEELNATQKLGQDLFAQSCGVCHLKPQLTAGLFGPTLSRDSANGDERLMREVIANGSPRMPGFKHQLTQEQIAAIAAYIKTVPPPAAAENAPKGPRGNMREAD